MFVFFLKLYPQGHCKNKVLILFEAHIYIFPGNKTGLFYNKSVTAVLWNYANCNTYFQLKYTRSDYLIPMTLALNCTAGGRLTSSPQYRFSIPWTLILDQVWSVSSSWRIGANLSSWGAKSDPSSAKKLALRVEAGLAHLLVPSQLTVRQAPIETNQICARISTIQWTHALQCVRRAFRVGVWETAGRGGQKLRRSLKNVRLSSGKIHR